MRFLFGFSIFLLFSCEKEAIDVVPDTCYNQSYASFRVDGEEQQVSEQMFEGLNLNYSYAAKPTGEWSIGLENDVHIISMTVFGFLTNEEYNELSKEEWTDSVSLYGNYNLTETDFLQQVVYQSLSDSIVFTKDHLVDGTVQMQYESKGICDFMKIDYVLIFSNDTLAKWVDGSVYVAIPLDFDE